MHQKNNQKPAMRELFAKFSQVFANFSQRSALETARKRFRTVPNGAKQCENDAKRCENVPKGCDWNSLRIGYRPGMVSASAIDSLLGGGDVWPVSYYTVILNSKELLNLRK